MAAEEPPGWRGKAGGFLASSSESRPMAAPSRRSRSRPQRAHALVLAHGWPHCDKLAGPPEPLLRSLRAPGAKLREAAARAGTAVAGAAEGAGSVAKSTWATTREGWSANVQPRVEPLIRSVSGAATETGSRLRRGIVDTSNRVAASRVGQRVGQATRSSLERSRSLLARADWRQKACVLALTDSGKTTKGGEVIRITSRPPVTVVSEMLFWWQLLEEMPAKYPKTSITLFGVPLEVAVQQANNARLVPHVLAECVNHLILSGLTTEELFLREGKKEVLTDLIQVFDEDAHARVPENTEEVDVAALILLYLQSLPEPLLTYELYYAIVDAGSDVQQLKELVSSLPPANEASLEFLAALFLRVAQKAELNKMDAHKLATVVAPALLWQKSSTAEQEARAKSSPAHVPAPAGEPLVDGEDAKGSEAAAPTGSDGQPTDIPLELEPNAEQAAVTAAVQCLIEHHDAIFAPKEAPWQNVSV
eukprot:SM000003S10993  [mRNA]  locus=s3:261413:264247:+ [translate_table: standard]